MDSLNDTLILIHDTAGKILFNLPAENPFIDEIKENDFLSVIHPDQREQALNYFADSKARGSFEYLLSIKNRQKQYSKYAIQSRFFVNGNQQLIHSHLYPVWKNKTASKSPVAKYLFPDNHLKFALDKANVPTILSQKNGRLIYCNQSALELLKIDSKDTHLFFAQDFYTHPEIRADFIKKLEQNKANENIEIKLRDNDGQYLWVLLKSRLILLHGEEVLLSNLMDISHQKEIENQHKLDLERLELATSAAKIGIWEYDLVTNKVDWNPTMYQLINHDISPADDNLKFFIKVTTESQRSQFISFLNNEEDKLIINHRAFIDNEEKHFQTTCRKYCNSYGELTKVLGVTIDVTELQINKQQVSTNLKDEALVANITTLLNTTIDFKSGLKHVMQLIGNHLGVEGIAIFYADKKIGVNKFLWGLAETMVDEKAEISLEDLQLIKEKEIFNDYEYLPASIKNIFAGAENLKFCLCPLELSEQQIGYVTFHQSRDRDWYNLQSEWIKTILNLISRAFEKEEHFQEIQRQQELLRNITNNLTDVITQTDLEGNITYVSPGWEKVAGYHPSEVIGKSSFNFIHPDDLFTVVSRFKKLPKTGTDSAQFRFLHKSGKYQWCETRSSLVYNKDNLIEGVITGGYIIEERVKAEIALRNNEQKYRTLFEKAPIGVLLVDAEGIVQEINQVLMETFHLESNKLERLNVFHKSWLKRSPIFQNIKNCIERNRVINGEAEYSQKDENVVIFKYYLNPLLIDEKVIQVQAVLVDITNQKEIEEALKKNQEKLQQITTNITDLVTEIDMNGIIVYASPSWELILGYKPMDIIGSSISDLLYNTTAAKLIKQIKRKAGNKRIKTFQHQMKSIDERVMWFESSGQPLTDDENNNIGIVFGSADITERKNAEHMLIEQNEALKKANEELDSFVYRSSHDLKAPLTSVLGLINISKYSEDLPERNNFLLLMEQTIKKLEKVIKQITDYSRNSRLQIQVEKINLNQLWKTLQEELSFMERFSDIEFQFNLEQSADFYHDRDRINILVKNILANAIIYRNWQNKINWINCKIEVDKVQAIITISDNGTGIVAEQQDKIFNMFHRSSSISKGAGLGLYVVKEILQRINGDIKFTSCPGKGSSFKIRVPNLKK